MLEATAPLPMTKLPPRPVRPADSDCCGSDCVLCVFTCYERELERWEEAVRSQAARPDVAKP